MIDFLIYALPRSGSAWVSNFLTHGDSFCYHEPLRYGSLGQLERPTPLVGCADTGAYLFDLEVKRRYVLIRNPRDVVLALGRLGLPMVQDFTLFQEQTAGLPVFRYERLFDVGYLREMWAEIVGPGFLEARARQLIDLSVVWRI